jgi:ribosomal protein S18 acetylase RimI-like enzyme
LDSNVAHHQHLSEFFRSLLTLDVMKNNRARFFYERLGFQVIGQSEHKLKMRSQENEHGSESQ